MSASLDKLTQDVENLTGIATQAVEAISTFKKELADAIANTQTDDSSALDALSQKVEAIEANLTGALSTATAAPAASAAPASTTEADAPTGAATEEVTS